MLNIFQSEHWSLAKTGTGAKGVRNARYYLKLLNSLIQICQINVKYACIPGVSNEYVLWGKINITKSFKSWLILTQSHIEGNGSSRSSYYNLFFGCCRTKSILSRFSRFLPRSFLQGLFILNAGCMCMYLINHPTWWSL